MSEGIKIADLNICQRVAIRPVLERALLESTTPRRLQQECIDACELAGCPIDPKLLEQE